MGKKWKKPQEEQQIRGNLKNGVYVLKELYFYMDFGSLFTTPV